MKFKVYAGFNNYYNRKIKKFNDIAAYQDYLLLTIDNVNFNPNDGIETTQVVNTIKMIDSQVFSIKDVPDYAIVCEDDGTIASRWFIMQWDRIREGQYNATLRRDVVADNFDKIIEAPCFIEKGTVTDKNDVAIFNNENMQFNQIKTTETLLKDLSNCPWIVGYIPSNASFHNPGITFYIGSRKYLLASVDNTAVLNMPFRMFCMPYADLTVYSGPANDRVYCNCTKDIELATATAISKTLGSANILDVQILPYCPLRDSDDDLLFVPDINGDEQGKYNLNSGFHFDYILDTTYENDPTVAGVIFWCDKNKFSFDIEYSIPYPNDAIDVKVKNECDMYRLCSPNFQGQFEFNPMKNGGVTKFNVDCMYQPFNPYIHINPDFGKLYGSDFDDARGLICGGDYSLPQESNAWANFQQNNKLYQASFDRQIHNMETMNMYARQQTVAQAVAGTLGGATSGGSVGAMASGGNPIAIGTTATLGGLASAFGGWADYQILRETQKETLDYTKDQFDFNMRNIKAMPNSVSKTNPFINNNKIFPLLEYYSCTETEKQALKDKLKYNGMTIGRIGKISDWLLDDYSYIKGQIIQLDNVNEEYHTALTIADEINKGIRAKKEGE